MESSRVFVRGLPPNISEKELRKHFDKFDKKDPDSSALTDAHFVPQRRIGYVGYKTPQAASKAVKYFNKSFIRMSRVIAEIARPVSEFEVSKRKYIKRLSPGKDAGEQNSKESNKASSKLESFVDTLKNPSNKLVWSNDVSADQPPINVLEKTSNTGEDSDESEYQHISKKLKLSVDVESRINKPQQTDSISANKLKQLPVIEVPVTEDNIATENDNNAVHVAPASDADWLRSRTNRVLDLLDEKDLQNRATQLGSEHANTLGGSILPNLEKQIESPAFAEGASDQPGEDTFNSQSNSQDTGRLLVRNLLFDTNEEELRSHFEPYGAVNEIHICFDNKTSQSKGFAFVQYDVSSEADAAKFELDGKAFQGRNLHIEAASTKRSQSLDETSLAKLPLKVQKQIKRKAGAATDTFKWNSLFMNSDAIMSSVATRLGVSKSDVLDPTSSDAAVKQAHAETKTIQDIQCFFKRNGVNVDIFAQPRRGSSSETAILVKNFPFGTTTQEIKDAFQKHGPLKRLLIPPSGTIAIVEMEQPTHAKSAFAALAYSKFKDSVLLLEKAPRALLSEDTATGTAAHSDNNKYSHVDKEVLAQFEQQDTSTTSCLFADRLPWSVTTQTLCELFRPLDGFLSARVVTKPDPKNPTQILSRGFGFIEFRAKAQAKAALLAMDGYMLDQQSSLVLKPSNKSLDVAEERRKEDKERKLANQRTKIVVKNLPFEASKKDVRNLLSPYGQLRSVRMPKKFDSSSRGFAFADFTTAKEAANAMEMLRNTHLLGRRLVLGFANAEAVDPEDEIERMQQKIERQNDYVALQKLTSGGRRKFRAQDNEGDND